MVRWSDCRMVRVCSEAGSSASTLPQHIATANVLSLTLEAHRRGQSPPPPTWVDFMAPTNASTIMGSCLVQWTPLNGAVSHHPCGCSDHRHSWMHRFQSIPIGNFLIF